MFSALKTPFITTGRWADIKRVGNLYGYDPNSALDDGSSLLNQKLAEGGIFDTFDNNYDPYPTWASDDEVPISKLKIQIIFNQLQEIFHFQPSNIRNMFDYLMKLLDSRASRMGPHLALQSLHADYIGGINANFRKWYFASQLDLDDSIGFENISYNGTAKRHSPYTVPTLSVAQKRWTENMNALSPDDATVHLALYLLCWGEANNIRMIPECLCFIFKCCNDYYYSLDLSKPIPSPERPFLDHIITPLYQFHFNQMYAINSKGETIPRNIDHDKILGYDDMNQLFWYRKGLERIVLKSSKRTILSFPPAERYIHLHNIEWSRAFFKTYYESRTSLHSVLNFNRVWSIHVCVFWLYTSFNSPTLYTSDYDYRRDNQPTASARLAVLSIAGSICLFLNWIAVIAEIKFVPRKWPGAESMIPKLLLLLILTLVQVAPIVYILFFNSLDYQDMFLLIISIFEFILSIAIIFYFSIVPFGALFGSYMSKGERTYLPSKYFTGSVPKLKGKAELASIGLWVCVFLSKFIETYFFLTLSIRDSVRELSTLEINTCIGETYFGDLLCKRQPLILLVLLFSTDLILFLLDTYLWFIIWNTLFSVCISFSIGISILTPWRNIFSRLPKRIYSKIINDNGSTSMKSKQLVSQLWNSIIISMYREHLLSIDHVNKLIYQQIIVPGQQDTSEQILKEPTFFVSQEDHALKTSLFKGHKEAERRITFFAQTLSTPIPESIRIEKMPSFSVLIPHYAEKISLSLREIIKEEDENSQLTLLEYLKQLHPAEWVNFVEDTKILAEEINSSEDSFSKSSIKDRLIDLPYYTVGFKTATPEYILRTRIWASLRTQTLYRTVSGFMNYSRAIKLLHDIENKDIADSSDSNKRLEEASIMALRKFRMVVSMQRFNKSSPEQRESKETLLRAYPELQIAYLEERYCEDKGCLEYYACLIDGSCEIFEDGERKPKYRIRLSGNPIIGDGKSDNQNHALIFCRGEYIQLIDANQDNYLEECLKVRNIFSEFEELTSTDDPYCLDEDTNNPNPVAIIGAREYIFSENVGVLGDVAAGKEQTFGTLSARTLALIGGKLHYGHPDFLSSVFMTTRGGVSKGQKSLHLNEDIYAGMNALLRGGRIKHSEYLQCGKGRDLGFGSILNFTSKIGSGMGEQMLSREYFYLGTQLPLDRLLSFYYAHAGFHLNNMFIFLTINLFILFSANLAALVKNSLVCSYYKNIPITDPKSPEGCFNLVVVILWLQRCVVSIILVFFISFIPLFVQEVTERGIGKAVTRLSKQFASFSIFFEVFVCKIYANSLLNNLSTGSAKYIATGRGFATTRMPFSVLYSKFSTVSLHEASILFFLLLFTSISMWRTVLIYFWFTITALVISPFLFNPNQFTPQSFFLDYRKTLQWLFKGNSKWQQESWIGYVRNNRALYTGSKRKEVKLGENIDLGYFNKPSIINLLLTQVGTHLLKTLIVFNAYLFSNSQLNTGALRVNTIMRLAVCSLGPIAVNIVLLLLLQPLSLIIAPLVSSTCWKSFPSVLAAITRILGLLNHILFFNLLWMFQNWELATTVLGFCCSCLIESLLFRLVTSLFLTSEFRHGRTNRAWWSGKWITSGLGFNVLSQPVREYFCKVIEQSLFAADFIYVHILLFLQIPIVLTPFIDSIHSLMLFWLPPSKQLKPQLFPMRNSKRKRTHAQLLSVLFLLISSLQVALIIGPYIISIVYGNEVFRENMPEIFQQLFQPIAYKNPNLGLKSHSIITDISNMDTVNARKDNR
ncbi:hypothetical protein LJB42_003573 [Komagataella kurtzmanii]|nr:hypothetical protein LJB42_003573 [Komagataella kurtzmanii]